MNEFVVFYFLCSEPCSESCQTSKIVFYTKIVQKKPPKVLYKIKKRDSVTGVFM